MSVPPEPTREPVEVVTCYRHADRRAGVSCQRCGRPICPSCMTQASVGFHCPECVKQAAKTSPTITARSFADRAPVVTYALIALNVLAFVAVLSSGGSLMDGGGSLTTRFGLVAGGSRPGPTPTSASDSTSGTASTRAGSCTPGSSTSA